MFELDKTLPGSIAPSSSLLVRSNTERCRSVRQQKSNFRNGAQKAETLVNSFIHSFINSFIHSSINLLIYNDFHSTNSYVRLLGIRWLEASSFFAVYYKEKEVFFKKKKKKERKKKEYKYFSA